jgi:hypothetical protein
MSASMGFRIEKIPPGIEERVFTQLDVNMDQESLMHWFVEIGFNILAVDSSASNPFTISSSERTHGMDDFFSPVSLLPPFIVYLRIFPRFHDTDSFLNRFLRKAAINAFRSLRELECCYQNWLDLDVEAHSVLKAIN